MKRNQVGKLVQKKCKSRDKSEKVESGITKVYPNIPKVVIICYYRCQTIVCCEI